MTDVNNPEPASQEMNPPEPTAEEIAAQKHAEAEQAERDERAQREADERAAHMAHPHTRLNAIAAQLRSPAAQQGDVTTRMAHLHSGVQQLIGIILEHTPAPGATEERHGEG